jgi:outer membrane protein assembly factor BamA
MDSWLYSSRLFLGYGVTPSIWAGPLLTGNYLEMYDDSHDRLIDSVESVVLGAQRTYVGLGAQLFADTRERSMYPRSGMYVAANAIGWFAADKGRQPFQTLQADIRLYTTPLEAEDLVLALRLGGMASFGEVIYYQSAVLGGRRSLRGYMFQRFRGDYSVYGSAEVRFPLFKQLIFLPVEFGAFFMGDVGRLWYQGESPGGMRGSWGVGIWGAGFSRDLLGILYVAFAREGAMVRAGFGFDY